MLGSPFCVAWTDGLLQSAPQFEESCFALRKHSVSFDSGVSVCSMGYELSRNARQELVRGSYQTLRALLVPRSLLF